MNIREIFYLIEYILWVITALIVVYPLVYTLASLVRRDFRYPEAKKKRRFVILFPAYKEDLIIEESVESFLRQKYPPELFHIVVISDHMQESTDERLSRLPITVLQATYDNSSKAKALNLAMDSLGKDDYDVVVILDADNIVEPDFLTEINIKGTDEKPGHMRNVFFCFP